jgi:hypothetical protein
LRIGLADDNLDDFAVLAEKVLASEAFNKLFTNYLWLQSGDVDEIPLSDSQACQVLPAEMVRFSFLGFLLLGSSFLLGLLGDVLSMLSQPGLVRMGGGRVGKDLLFGADDFVLYGSFVVRSSASRAEAIHSRLDVVVAELTYLEASEAVGASAREAHLIAAGTGPEVLVREVKLLDA